MACLASLTLVMAQGCFGGNGDTRESTVSASGTLSYQGKPLEFHQVYFSTEGHRPATGISDADGKFSLGTNQQGDGAAPGSHKVFLVYVGPPSTNPEAGITDFTPPPPPKVKIPQKYHRAETSGLVVEIPKGGTSDLKIDLK
ncbi:hypothetical protein [Planctomicrobium sp. SH527]|uniref:hypothetical protein n=1 Tax=Planctomicrobium sp. SH527 TaxID=3448123 RepID=UPI003F5C0F71